MKDAHPLKRTLRPVRPVTWPGGAHHLSLLLAIVYLALSCGAMYCVISHDAGHARLHHHSNNHVAHSPLCSWACQVSSKANAADTAHHPLLTFLLVFAGVILLLFQTPSQPTLSSPLARGPPA